MLSVKPFKSSPAHCGPGVFKMILGYYGIERTEKQLAKELKWNPTDGVTAQNMVKTAKKYGLEGFIKDNSSLEDICSYVLKKETPVIVEWFLEDDSHFSVVAGIDKKNIYLVDPFIGKIRTLKRDYFVSIWFGFEGEYIKTKDDIFLRRMVVLEK